MTSATPTTATIAAPTTSAPQRPRTVVDSLATRRAASQRAATEGRLELLTDATITEDSTTGSLVGVAGGIMGFVTFAVAVPLTAWAYLARLHHGTWQLEGVTLPALIAVNLLLGYGASVAHEWLHALACRTQGGNAFLVPAASYRFAWTAPNQGFSRSSYAVVLLAPLVVVAAVWLIVLAISPAIASYLIVPAVVNAALAGADLWTFFAMRRQPARADLFIDRHPGFAAYAITITKPVRKTVVKKAAK
ncbi:MAG: DUF3267 domain-containing protein [Ktedonobacterales bacterium]|nr:DUF3267 domain-containing protein [Ktedonobacterales bacterium]